MRTVVESPIGGIGLIVVDGAVVEVSFDARTRPGSGHDPGGDVLAVAAEQLREFFRGERTTFDLPLAIRRGSVFERAVWAAIARIPYGQTASYGAIARSVGEPGAAQAVGLACNRNPLPIVVPCHRVIGSDGKLVGFGGGLDRKRWLLGLEARIEIERMFADGLT
ncbi:MAG TPA: methylated-DNA--[protein]-cysteine S-methyltransferase [Micromonosporaceae bacterium]